MTKVVHSSLARFNQNANGVRTPFVAFFFLLDDGELTVHVDLLRNGCGIGDRYI